MRNNLLSACVLFSLLFSYNGIGAEAQSSVMLFGVFHFANPGLDKVKTDQFNVMTDEKPVGATATASWWHRNFRMFAKIQRHALSAKDQRVLVIGGQGHTAILKDFLSLDDRLESVDVASFL